MNFRVCFNCKEMTWFDIKFTFLRIKTPKVNPLPENYIKFNVENGDYLIDFRPEIYCNHTNGNLRHKVIFDPNVLLEEFYFKQPDILKFALLKKDFIRKKKISIRNEDEISSSLFFKSNENNFYYICDAEPNYLRDRLIEYMKTVEQLMFPADSCKYSFEHIVFGKE